LAPWGAAGLVWVIIPMELGWGVMVLGVHRGGARTGRVVVGLEGREFVPVFVVAGQLSVSLSIVIFLNG